MVRKFIIDTDTGVDDAMALLMALDAHVKGEVISLSIKISPMSGDKSAYIDRDSGRHGGHWKH